MAGKRKRLWLEALVCVKRRRLCLKGKGDWAKVFENDKNE